jgi:integrase
VANRRRTKAPKDEQLKGDLNGDLLAYQKVGLYQRSVNQKTAYRYRGVFLRYQLFLGENPPSLAATQEFLGLMRKNGADPSTLRIYRAALAGFHQWRGEELKFTVKVPRKSAKYVPWGIVQRMLELAAAKPHDELVLRLITDAGLRRSEVAELRVSNIEGSRLRFMGKGGKKRTIPMTAELQKLVDHFSANKPRNAYLVGLGGKGVYNLVKRYGVQAGIPEITPHDLRRAFGTHLLDVTGNIRIVQEILGHSDVNTTQIYTAVTLDKMEEAIKRLNSLTDDGKKTAGLPPVKEVEAVSRVNTYHESPHKRQMREMARKTASGIKVPSPWDKELWRELPVEFRPGKYYLSLGAVTIYKDGRLKVKYPAVGAGTEAPHLIKALFSHLGTSGKSRFTGMVGEKGGLNVLASRVEQYSLALLKLLKLIKDEITGYQTKINFHDEAAPGLTKWFVISAWNGVIQKADGHSWIDRSWYKTFENDPATSYWQLRVGGTILAIANSQRALHNYKTLHRKLMLKFAKDPLTKEIAIKNRELESFVLEIKQRLHEFSDVQQVPGHCELC